LRELNLLTTKLKKIDVHKDIHAYIFGSVIRSKTCNDIDLFIVYGGKYSIEEILKIRLIVKDYIRSKFKITADIGLFSENEKEYLLYIVRESAKCIYPNKCFT
jgi:predicted nucleotidyltransferase